MSFSSYITNCFNVKSSVIKLLPVLGHNLDWSEFIGTNCTYKKAAASRGPRQVVAKPPELIACTFVPT